MKSFFNLQCLSRLVFIRVKHLLLLVFAFTCDAVACQPISEVTSAAKQAVIQMTKEPLINSVSVGLVYKGVPYSFHSGELKKNGGNPPNDETIYEIGSLSKVFTGTMVAKAVIEKKVDVDDNILTYMGEGYSNLTHKKEPVRVRHLLTHTSGLPSMLPVELIPVLNNFLDYETPNKLNRALESYSKSKFLQDLQTIEIKTEPGTSHLYSNAGVELVAHILEKSYGIDYEELLLSFLVKNMNMMNTKMTLSDEEEDKLAIGYHYDNNAIPEPMLKLPWGAAGSMKTTTSDMVKFINYQLSGRDIVKESRRKIRLNGNNQGTGYFWNVDYSDSKLGEYFFHHGGVPRTQSYLFIFPKHDFGIFMITNQSGKDTASKMRKALDTIFTVIEE